MSLRRLRIYLVVSVLVAVVALGATFASSNEPVLGLDLQGGISVVLAPVGKFKPSSLDVAVDIIRNRVDSLGVAEPEISRQGDNIVVDLPGVKDREKARRLVGRTAELRFRPVLGDVPAAGATVTTTTVAGATTTSTAPGATTTTTTSANDAAAKAAIASCDPTQVEALLAAGTNLPTTSLADNKRDACVVLPERGGTRLYLGKTALTGKAVSGADSKFAQGQGYTVSINFTNAGSSAVGRTRPAVLPPSRRDRARRRGAVGAGDPA